MESGSELLPVRIEGGRLGADGDQQPVLGPGEFGGLRAVAAAEEGDGSQRKTDQSGHGAQRSMNSANPQSFPAGSSGWRVGNPAACQSRNPPALATW